MTRARGRRFALAAAVALTLLPAVQRAEARALPGCASPANPGGEWRSYGHDYANTRTQEQEHTIGGIEAALLAPAWTFSSTAAGGEGDFTGTPTIADGCLYIASNRGWVFALNADTGALVWKARTPLGGGVNSSVNVTDGKVFVAVSSAGRGTGCTGDRCGPYVVAFRQRDGRVAWKPRVIDRQPGADAYGSPVVWNGLLFVGVSGGSAELDADPTRFPFQGAYALLDAGSGQILKKTYVIPRAQWKDGYAGATIWSTPAIDTRGRTAYVGTSNPFQPQKEHPRTNSVLKIDLDRRHRTFGEILGSYKGTVDEYIPGMSELPCYDIPGNPPPYYPQGVGSCGDIDLDFGANPNLFRDADGRLLVGAGQKSGVFHAFDAKTMKGAWTTFVGPPSSVGGIVGSTAYDGVRFYGPITAAGYLWAIDSQRGTNAWVSPIADGVHWGEPVAVANGVVYTVDLKGFLDAVDARNGLPLLHRPMFLDSGTASNPVLSWGGVSVARNTVYAGVGISGLSNGFVIAFRPGASGAAPAPAPAPGGGGGGAPGAPAGPTVVAGPGGYLTTYATPAMAVPRGGALSFANFDLPQHDVVAIQKNKKGKPLFASKLIGLGEVTPVNGVAALPSGGYPFYCSIHPGMRGTLTVL